MDMVDTNVLATLLEYSGFASSGLRSDHIVMDIAL